VLPFAAAFIRMFLIEAYKIPTPSMEGSLLVGDFLFVSKAHYGIRTPMTIAMFCFTTPFRCWVQNLIWKTVFTLFQVTGS
jgi:signal peptidase I